MHFTKVTVPRLRNVAHFHGWHDGSGVAQFWSLGHTRYEHQDNTTSISDSRPTCDFLHHILGRAYWRQNVWSVSSDFSDERHHSFLHFTCFVHWSIDLRRSRFGSELEAAVECAHYVHSCAAGFYELFYLSAVSRSFMNVWPNKSPEPTGTI